MNVTHKAWRWYFWASVVVTALSLGFEVKGGFADQGWGELLYSAFGYVVEILALVCLYGFVWQVRFGKHQYWAVFFFVNIVFFLSSIGYAVLSNDSEFIESMGLGFTVGVLLLGTALTIPMFIANFLYAFRNKHLWAV